MAYDYYRHQESWWWTIFDAVGYLFVGWVLVGFITLGAVALGVRGIPYIEFVHGPWRWLLRLTGLIP